MPMQREFLRGLGLEEETVTKVINEHHNNIAEMEKKANDYKAELDSANDELKNRDEQIEDLKKSTTNNEDLQKQLDEYKANNEKYEQELQSTRLNNAIKLAVAKDANDPDDVLALLDKSDLELDGDTVKGLDDKITALRESKPYLFEQPKGKTGRTPQDGNPPQSMTKEQIMGMTDPIARQKAIKENMNLFN
ncbi:phage scaffolding protein [Jeotgalicoccus sp. S0W5]|uniref:phage scaffolding protein n=1 Tax=Jeotgalicoccus sp. S0W5 TaxID=2527874 RepID=UPI001F10BB8F|nr:phage scaffolding protein [Jeotgalicoccus sp. S0W5]